MINDRNQNNLSHSMFATIAAMETTEFGTHCKNMRIMAIATDFLPVRFRKQYRFSWMFQGVWTVKHVIDDCLWEIVCKFTRFSHLTVSLCFVFKRFFVLFDMLCINAKNMLNIVSNGWLVSRIFIFCVSPKINAI